MSGDAPVPTALVFLLCENVIQEAVTNKKSLINIFDRALVPTPSDQLFLPPLWIYAKLADAEGEYQFKIEIVGLEGETQIGRVELPLVTIKNRLMEHDLVLKIPPIAIPGPGDFEYQLTANGVWICRTILHVLNMEELQP